MDAQWVERRDKNRVLYYIDSCNLYSATGFIIYFIEPVFVLNTL